MKNGGNACSDLFSQHHYIKLWAQASFHSHDDLDLTLIKLIIHTRAQMNLATFKHSFEQTFECDPSDSNFYTKG